ncbi:pirin family protein [Heterostelium album PN500]|uniref:Pirin family protein n=1 Tax=Heterostelium pallidum (strain ATCC 26659 / Pp 5 / PN500) TaxID=670386 RepID=D3BT94_HETP5|nr:pirin family protein [Heterostelium album PN500]EFA75311.1 pirin family protein [Heterostelium album PN500]|eukprot:XP_020427445.1 pirin family protein [Heterostelium album PN500]
MSSRLVSLITDGLKTSDGAGVNLTRMIPIRSGFSKAQRLDPFLMLDHIASDDSDDYIEGFPEHGHRGFETVTYMLEGSFEHKDNKGNRGLLVPGSVQWMTAGRGIIHSEMPMQDEGKLKGFQFWINLPHKDKMMAPRYQDIMPENIPVVKEDGNTIKVLAGHYKETEGAVKDIVTKPLFLDIDLKAGAKFSTDIAVGHSSFVFIISGEGAFGPDTNAKLVKESQLAVLDGSNNETRIDITASDKGLRLMLLSAAPIGEPICQYGPFVMCTQEEIDQAFDDFYSGRF